MPGRPPGPRGSANLKTKRLIYLTNAEIFRYIEQHPFTCVQVVTFHERNEELITETVQMPGRFQMPKEPKFAAVVREVQFWNCDGFEQGERRNI